MIKKLSAINSISTVMWTYVKNFSQSELSVSGSLPLQDYSHIINCVLQACSQNKFLIRSPNLSSASHLHAPLRGRPRRCYVNMEKVVDSCMRRAWISLALSRRLARCLVRQAVKLMHSPSRRDPLWRPAHLLSPYMYEVYQVLRSRHRGARAPSQ